MILQMFMVRSQSGLTKRVFLFSKSILEDRLRVLRMKKLKQIC